MVRRVIYPKEFSLTYNKHSDYNHAFKKAIRKYSPENMLWEVIDTAIDTKTANELEKRYILHFESYKKGYNMTLGGDGGSYYTYTKQEIKSFALKCKTKSEFSSKYNAVYNRLRRLKDSDPDFYNECISHMTVYFTDWDKKTLAKIALKYNKRSDFKNKDNTAWRAALRFGKEFYKETTAHMKIKSMPRLKWTNKLIKKTALKYDHLIDMRTMDNKAYQALKNIKKIDRTFYDECTAHMKRPKRSKGS